MATEYWTGLLRNVFAGRKVIVTVEVLAASTDTVAAVRELGAIGVLVVATNGRGAGPIPGPEDAAVVMGSVVAFGALAMIRAGHDLGDLAHRNRLGHLSEQRVGDG